MSYPDWPIPQGPLSPSNDVPANVEIEKRYRIPLVDKDGYAAIHPDLLARLTQIELALTRLLQRVVENNARRP